jgi:ribosome-associated heat shock protein Hsp15
LARGAGMSGPPPSASLRADKWLVFARFVKTRAIAAEIIESGHLRVNGAKVKKPGYGLSVGDVLTLAYAERVRLIRVLDLAERRGPAAEAQQLYQDLDSSTPLE